jgi:DNA-binding response OmpR family regulator
MDMDFKGRCALVVDDDPLVGANHADILEDAGLTVLRAPSVAAAWGVVRSRPFDVILLDHDLGDGKGWDLLKLMRGASLRAPTVYLSAALPSTMEAASALPEVVAALSKPVAKEALLEALASLFGKEPHDGGSLSERYPKLVGDAEREMLFSALAPRPDDPSKEGAG